MRKKIRGVLIMITTLCLIGCTSIKPDIAMAKSKYTVKTKKAFHKKLHDCLTKRKTKFKITYTGKGKINEDKMFKRAIAIDDKKTSDDYDYLNSSIKSQGYAVMTWNKKQIFNFSIKYRENAGQVKQVNRKVRAVLKQLKLKKKRREEKVKIIHDYICNRVSYDNSYTGHSAWRGLVHDNHTTVCDGYACLFYKMCTEAGIPCRILDGTAGDNGDWGLHAWNMVKIGKKWYYVDVTWDDTDNADKISYDYYLKGKSSFKNDHILDDKYQTDKFKKRYKVSETDYGNSKYNSGSTNNRSSNSDYQYSDAEVIMLVGLMYIMGRIKRWFQS